MGKPLYYDRADHTWLKDPMNRSTDEEREAWFRLSIEGWARAYGEEEPEYPIELIREPNPERLSHRKTLSLDHPEKSQRRSL